MTDSGTRSRYASIGVAALVAMILFVSIGSAPAAAQWGGDGGDEDRHPAEFLCIKYDEYDNEVYPGEPGYEDAEYEPIVYLLQNVIGVFMVIGPVAGVVVGLYATVAGVLSPGGEDGGNYTRMRRNSLLLGFGVPIAAYVYKLLGEAILPYNTGCIVPDLPL